MLTIRIGCPILKSVVGLIKRAFVFLLHPTASRTNMLVLLLIFASIPLTVLSAKKPQQINQQPAVKNVLSTSQDNNILPSQPQNSTLFYIEPFTIAGIKKTNTPNKPKDKNITFYLYNLIDDPEKDEDAEKAFRKLTISSSYDKNTNTFSSSKFHLDNLPQGKYQLLLKIDGSLRQSVGIKDIYPNETVIIQEKKIKLVMGDVNNDNKLNILDYDLILSCFEDKIVTSFCVNKDSSDLNFDGINNGLDYDIFLKNLSLVSKLDKL